MANPSRSWPCWLHRTVKTWIIFAEVAYLLGIAQQRLSFERDVPTAIRAMEAADQRFLNLIRPDLETVRAVLMADINDLRAVPVVDTIGPALYLADVLKRTESGPPLGGQLPYKRPCSTSRESVDD